MEKKKLIILEGGDGLGKTTLGTTICNHWAKVGYVKMPSEHGHFASLYNFLKKKNKLFTPLETQLFLTLSNYATLIRTMKRGCDVFLLDRSPMSTLAYLLKTGETELLRVDILLQAINAMCRTIFDYENPVEIKYVILQGKTFKDMEKENIFEEKGNMSNDQCYNVVLDMLSQEGRYLMVPDETYHTINVTGKKEIAIYGETYDHIKNFLITK